MRESADVLSLWRSPLDKVALSEARSLCDGQPKCSIAYNEDFSPMTIYNFGYYITKNGNQAESALVEMFGAMSSGGLAFIPQQSFQIDTAKGPFDVPDQCNIVSSGGAGTAGPSGGTSFFHFMITSAGSSTFLTCNPGTHSSGGIYLRGLGFQWVAPPAGDDTCIAAGVENVRAVRCTFTDCPIAFNANGLSCTLEQCTINYTVTHASGPNGTSAVILRMPECAVMGPGVFSQTSRKNNGATGCTCISIQGAEHVVIANMQLYEWTIGVDFSQGPTGQTLASQITNCEIECWQHALNIKLPDSNSTAAGIKVTDCTLAKASDSDDGAAIVTIDASGGTLHDVTLLNCTVLNMADASAISGQYGLQISSGTDVKIIGGAYSNNSHAGGAGIAITPPVGAQVTDIQIINADLRPNYPAAPNQNSQQYALLVTNGSSLMSALVSGCDMTGYSPASPVSVSGSPTYLLITDCPGYNDQNTSLTATTTQLTSGVSASSSSTPYYGPSVITYSSTAPVTLHVFGQAITASMGIIFLPNPYDSFYFSARPAIFSWTGK